jgi:serine/threonine protein kinase
LFEHNSKEGPGKVSREVFERRAPPRALEQAERGSVSAPPVQVGGLASWRPSARLSPVERYDRFEILGRIGRGGMAEILLARERSLTGGSRHLVIKRVLPEVRDFDELLHMFLDETRVVMGLSHPNLCQIYEVGEQDGAWYIAMEWVNGVTLGQLVRRAIELGDIDYGVIARITAQCADALQYAHTARDAEGQLINLVHRDVSPHNMMVAYDGRVKLLDFGIAKSTATTHRTEAGVVKGKICYMAPEQWLSSTIDGRTDVFALGACLFEALSGRVVFKRENQLDVMKAAIAGDVPSLREIAPNVPAALADVVHRALEPKPERRFQSAREMSEALERFLSTLAEPVSAARIADYTRRLFQREVQLGPVLERSLRGAQIAPTEGMFLPPLPASLQGIVKAEASLRPLPPLPFSFSPPPVTLRSSLDTHGADRPWPAEGAFDNEELTERARIGATRTAPVRAMDDTAATPSQAPTSPKVPSLRDLLPVTTDILARPLARTLSMRVTQRARRALVASALVLAAVVPLVFGGHELLAGTATPVIARSDESVSARPGAFPAPVFTLLPPGTPKFEVPSSEPVAQAVTPVVDQHAGRLSINTRPWSTVYLGKRLLGTTPLADVAVPRGALNLKLVDRDGRVHIRRLPASNKKARAVSYEF